MDKQMLSINKFINRAYKSEASILVFYYKDLNSSFGDENIKQEYDYLIIRKRRIIHDFYNDFLPDLEIYYSGEDSFEITINIQQLNELKEVNTNDNYNKLFNIEIQRIDLNNYYKLLTKSDFVEQLDNVIGINEYYFWQKEYCCGLIIDQKVFKKRISDFGNDNTQTYIYANSSYFGFRKDKVFSVNKKPSDSISSFAKIIKKLGEEMFNYYYDGNKFLLINFDEMDFHNFQPKIFFENRRHIITSIRKSGY